MNIISKYIEKKSCIVDIGCGNGNLLSLLKLNGYNNIIGIEPSEKNVDHIRKDLGILAYVGSIGNDNLTINEKFDLIVMTGVLEHIIDLKSFLCECLRYLKNDGYICITVPDVMQFINNDDLYQQFSVEHINFFTKKTLEQIFGRFGVSNIYYDNSLDGAIVGLYKFDNMYKSDSYIDYDGKKMIQQYIGNMNVTKQRIESVINRYRNKKLYVWGCGTHTAMLFQLGMLKNIDIVGIIDSNINYNGKIVNGYEVMYPSKTLNSNYPILISSKLAQESIKNDITNKYALLNDIICLYN